MAHICVSNLTLIGSDNGLSPERRQAIIWTSAGILLIGTLRTIFCEILSEIHAVSFKKMHLKTSSSKWQPFYLSLNVLTNSPLVWALWGPYLEIGVIGPIWSHITMSVKSIHAIHTQRGCCDPSIQYLTWDMFRIRED